MFPPDVSQSPHATPGGFGPTAILKERFFLSWPEKKESLGSFFFYFRQCYVFWYQGTTQRRLSGEEWFILQPQAWVTPKKPLDKCPRIFAAFLKGTAMLWTWSINLSFRSGSQAESRDVALASSVESHPLTDRHFLSLQSLARSLSPSLPLFLLLLLLSSAPLSSTQERREPSLQTPSSTAFFFSQLW